MGFILAELKEAGVRMEEALAIGIIVDHRRRNLSKKGKKVDLEQLNASRTV